ncbi:MAG: alpha/beta hydrolase [Rectinemataceae bacterium]
MEGSFIDAGGLSLFFAAEGSGTPILFVHGNTGSSRWFSRVMDMPGYRTAAVDMPNFGRSAAMPGEVDLHAYADYMADFIEAAGLEGPILVGHSLGGAVAQALAVCRPELITGLVLVDSSAPYGLVTPEERNPLIEMMRKDRSFLEKALSATVPTLADPVFFASLVDDAVAMAAPAWIGNARALSRFDMKETCSEFKKPVLVIWGRKDYIISEKMARDTAAAFPDSELEIVEQVGHSPMVEDPALFKSMIAAFASKIGRGTTSGKKPETDRKAGEIRDSACMEE